MSLSEVNEIKSYRQGNSKHVAFTCDKNLSFKGDHIVVGGTKYEVYKSAFNKVKDEYSYRAREVK